MTTMHQPPAGGNLTTSVPGLLSGPTVGLAGRVTERWRPGAHAERRLRELRDAVGPGAVSSWTETPIRSQWTGPLGEQVLEPEVVVAYPASVAAKVPAPSAASAVRAAFRREASAAEVG